MLYEIGKLLFSLLFKLLFKIKVEARAVFPKDKPFIIVSNHLSNLDPIAVGIVCPVRLSFLAKEELFRNKIFAFVLRRVRAFPLRRKEKDIGALRSCLRILKKDPLLLFPQGTRSSNYDTFASGVGFLYKKTGVPIIAAKIYGTDKVFPKGARFIRRGEIRIIFDRVSGIKDTDSAEEVTLKVREKIKNL